MTKVYGLWVAVALFYWPTTLALNALWTQPAQQETYTHGYLILLISLWLVWRERRQLAAKPARPCPLAVVPLLVLSALWVWAWRAAIQELHMVLVPLILFTALLAVLGPRASRMLAFPIGYLYFALPFWSACNFILQALSARMTGVLVWLTGLPAFMHGNFIELPAGSIRIAGGCSGLHSFIVGLALAALYGKVSDLPLRRRLGAVALMGALALIVNWARIFIVTAVAYATDMHSSLVRNHYWLGWWLFAAAFAGFLWWMERRPLARKSDASRCQRMVPPAVLRFQRSRATAIAAVVAAVVIFSVLVEGLRVSLTHNYYGHFWIGWSLCSAILAGGFWWARHRHVKHATLTATEDAPRVSKLRSRVEYSGTGIAQVLATLLTLAILPATAYGIDWAHTHDNPAVTIQWPKAPTGWEGPARVSGGPWHPYFVDASSQSMRVYTNGGKSLQVFAVVYRVQTQQGKLLGYWNRLLGKSGDLGRQSQRIVDSPTGRWIETQVSDGAGGRSLIWSRYRVGTHLFVDPRLSQAWYGLAALLDPPLSSLIALRTICQPDCRAARARLSAVARSVQPTFSTP